jgi:hypothetical protein
LKTNPEEGCWVLDVCVMTEEGWVVESVMALGALEKLERPAAEDEDDVNSWTCWAVKRGW